MNPRVELVGIAVASVAAVVARRLVGVPRHPEWSFQVETLVEVTRRLAAGSLVRGPRWSREALDAAPPFLPADLRPLRIEPVDADGVPCRWTWPTHMPSAVPARAIVYLHGGGYVSGSLDTHREIAARSRWPRCWHSATRASRSSRAGPCSAPGSSRSPGAAAWW